nr:hypothetical protein [Candidatus Sigynarchaeota archaeon]
IGVDAFSRSIWTFYISFDEPSQEAVTKAILKGLYPKVQLDEWSVFQAYLAKKGYDMNAFHYNCGGFPTVLQVDNGKDFQAESVKKLCLDLNITLESRPVRMPEFGGFIESIWDTINDAIRGDNLHGRVYSMPKSREACVQPKFKKPTGYDAKKDATITIDEFEEWLFAYIVTRYSNDTKARQNHSPNETWNDGLIGGNYQPMGGTPRFLTPAEYKKLDYLSKIDARCILTNRGLRYLNVYYTSDWLIEARKERTLKDGDTVEFKISHKDMRYAWMIDPSTREIRVLEAYNYDGDDRIKKFMLKGVGKLRGFREFPISLKMLEHVKKLVSKTSLGTDDGESIMKMLGKELADKGKLGKKERQVFQALAKDKEGKKKIEKAVELAQRDDEKIEPVIAIQKQPDPENEEEDDFVPMPTTWDEAKELTDYSKYKDGGKNQ